MRIKILLAAPVLAALMGCATASKDKMDVFGYGHSALLPASRLPASGQLNFSPPNEAVFDEIRAYAVKYNYFGNDIVACMDTENKKLKLGGSHHWGGTYQLFMDYSGGRMDIGKFSQMSSGTGSVQKFKNGNLTLTMEQMGHGGSVTYFAGQVENSDSQSSEMLLCYLSASGLE